MTVAEAEPSAATASVGVVPSAGAVVFESAVELVEVETSTVSTSTVGSGVGSGSGFFSFLGGGPQTFGMMSYEKSSALKQVNLYEYGSF